MPNNNNNKPKREYAIIWENWGIGGWVFFTLEEAIKIANKYCYTLKCNEIKIAKKTDSGYEIVYFSPFINTEK